MLDAAKRCCERWGMAKVTVDDIAAEAGISRATLYRLFPGGKEVLYEALRRRDSNDFFIELQAHVATVDSLEEAPRAHRRRGHPSAPLGRAPPGHAGLSPGRGGHDAQLRRPPRDLRDRHRLPHALVAGWIGEERAAELAELLSRLVVSYFLTPSRFVDFGDPASARRFIRNHVLPAFPVPSSDPTPTTSR